MSGTCPIVSFTYLLLPKATTQAMQFKEMNSMPLSKEERKVLEYVQAVLHGSWRNQKLQNIKGKPLRGYRHWFKRYCTHQILL